MFTKNINRKIFSLDDSKLIDYKSSKIFYTSYLPNNKINTYMSIAVNINRHTIKSCDTLKYLGIVLDHLAKF